MKKTLILLVGSILLTAFIAGCDGASNKAPTANTNSTANAPAKAKAQDKIPPNAPPGAQPPEQSGNPSASVALEEFADFQCGSCAAAHSTMNEIKSMYGSRIHFVYRNFPLPMHDKGYDASLAATAAGMQNKFWDMQNMLFTNQKSWMSDPTYKQVWKGYAQKIGLDVPKWESDMNGMGAKNRVDADIARGKAIPVSSTPTLFVNGVAVAFADMTVTALKTLIDGELQKSSGQNPGNAPAAANSNK
ncbi:MAG: DsbA family protein [Pyrinomonadaceae bacterium]